MEFERHAEFTPLDVSIGRCVRDAEYCNAVNAEFEEQTGAKLTNIQVCSLYLLSGIKKGNIAHLSDNQRWVLGRFFNEVPNNLNLNKELLKQNIGKFIGVGLHQGAIEDVKAITFKTRHLHELDAVLGKAERLFGKINNGEVVDASEKLNIREVAILSELAKLHPLYSRYSDAGAFVGNDNATGLIARLNQSKEYLQVITSSLADMKFETAGIAVKDMDKFAESKGKKLTATEKMDRFFSRRNHAALLSTNPDTGALQQTHLYADYRAENMDALTFLYNDVFEIRLENLISPDAKNVLRNHYGDQWQGNVNALFRDLQRQVHDNNVFGMANATVGRKSHLVAGVSQVPIIGNIVRSEVFSKHPERAGLFPNIRQEASQKNIKSPEQYRQELFGEDRVYDNQKILCTEHVAITLIGTLEQLNNHLKAETGSDLRMVRSPIPANEDLHKITPDRLIKVLASDRGGNCIRRVDAPESLQKYVDQSETRATRSFK